MRTPSMRKGMHFLAIFCFILFVLAMVVTGVFIALTFVVGEQWSIAVKVALYVAASWILCTVAFRRTERWIERSL